MEREDLLGDATQQSGNRTLDRTAAILDALEHEMLTLSEIARRTALSTSAVHRLLNSLEELGFVRRSDGLFALGARFQRSTMEKAIRHTLAVIRDETGESCQFWVKLDRERLCVAIADSGHELRPILAEGTRIRLQDGGSAGLVLRNDERARDSLVRHGWVETVDDRTPGLASVSLPLILRGSRYGVVCIVVPVSRLTESPGRDFGPIMRRRLQGLREELDSRF